MGRRAKEEKEEEDRKVGRKRSNVSPYHVRVSPRFLSLTVLGCVVVAFAVGRIARIILIINPQKRISESPSILSIKTEKDSSGRMELPSPIMKEGKAIPRTTYTSKNFDTARSASINSRWVVSEGESEKENCHGSSTPNDTCRNPSVVENDDLIGGEEEIHEPRGQHLLVDIENVDSGFLDSEERLAKAMLELVNLCGLTLLSYHCHRMVPSGVSCAGVLLESHVSFHTWPAEGVITLDLYTCGPNILLPFVSTTEQLFAIPSATSINSTRSRQPHMIWSHKFRGFSDNIKDEIAERADFFRFPIGMMTEYKEEIISARTQFQKVDIYDVLLPHFQSFEAYEKSRSDVKSYESSNPEFFQPDRFVFLDGIMQSRRSGDAQYHESLVHPGMFAHPNPKRVAIIGGGEGATLREVLKHKTVEKVTMIEIDEEMVKLSKEYLPFWSDCSHLVGSTNNCFDDSRVDVFFEDAFQWFIDRFNDDGLSDERFDVIIMDALDPQVQVEFVDALYDGGPFLRSIPNGLNENGILIAQVGEAPKMADPGEDFSWHRNRLKFVKTLINTGFESIRDYEESHAGFYYPWQFIVAFKNFKSRGGWFVDEAVTNLQIHERIIPTKDGKSALKYFDGATMVSYRYPSKASEKVFCLRDSNSQMCQESYESSSEPFSLDLSILELESSGDGRGFATKSVPVKSTEDAGDSNRIHESVIYQYFSGDNTYNPFAERQPHLHANLIHNG